MRNICRLFLISFLLYTSSCIPNDLNLTGSPTLTITPSSSVPSKTPTPTKFVYTAQSPSITPLATLSSEEAAEQIKAFFQSATNCVSPCFMNVIPGQTTIDEANAMFSHLGVDLQHTTSVGNYEFYAFIYRFEDGSELSPIFTTQDNIVKNIGVGIIPSFQEKDSTNEWLTYSPDSLVDQYGQPSRVEFVLGWGPRSFFDMIMYFDSYDLVTEYVGYNIIEGTRENPNVCVLAVQYDSVRVWLGKNPPNLPSEGVPLSEATQLDMEEFSNILLGQPENACITFDGKVFP